MSLAHILLLGLVAAVQDRVVGDEIILRDGTRLTGDLVSWNKAEVVFRASDGEDMHLTPVEIARLHLSEASIRTVASTLPEPEPVVPVVQWTGTADFGYTGKRGTVASDSSALSFKAERKTKENRLGLYSRYFYATQDEVLSGDQFAAGGRFDRFFSGRFFVFGSGDFETNKVERVDFRGVLSAGLGYDVLDTEREKLSVNAGLGYTREEFTDGVREDSPSALFNQELQWRIRAQVKLEQAFRYLQDMSEVGRFKLRLSGTLRTELNGFLNFSLGFVKAYDNQPPVDAEKNELTVLTGLGFVF